MIISIYQIDPDRGLRKMFLGTKELEKLYGKDIDPEIYEEVFSGVVDCDTLDDVYALFNADPPDGYQSRSLSVSDVVEVRSSDCTNYYFCDCIGWKRINSHTRWYEWT